MSSNSSMTACEQASQPQSGWCSESLQMRPPRVKPRVQKFVSSPPTSPATRHKSASVARLRREVQTAGGRGSGEESLRAQLEQTLASEREVLAMSRDPSQAALTARVDALNATIDSVASRNRAFRDSLDGAVEGRLVGARAAISQEREALARDREALDALDQKAASLRDQATGVALDRVRRDISRIVLRADVGTIDTAFARKQAQTEQIGAFERARAAELTDLTQAYADLTRDDLP